MKEGKHMSNDQPQEVRHQSGDPTLAEFLLARITEDEAVAREALALTGIFDELDLAFTSIFDELDSVQWHWGVAHGSASQWTPTPHDPARVRRECKAKRLIVDMWDADSYINDDGEIYGGQGPETHHETLCLLAAVYADHPDYRDEWRP